MSKKKKPKAHRNLKMQYYSIMVLNKILTFCDMLSIILKGKLC